MRKAGFHKVKQEKNGCHAGCRLNGRLSNLRHFFNLAKVDMHTELELFLRGDAK